MAAIGVSRRESEQPEGKRVPVDGGEDADRRGDDGDGQPGPCAGWKTENDQDGRERKPCRIANRRVPADQIRRQAGQKDAGGEFPETARASDEKAEGRSTVSSVRNSKTDKPKRATRIGPSAIRHTP